MGTKVSIQKCICLQGDLSAETKNSEESMVGEFSLWEEISCLIFPALQCHCVFHFSALFALARARHLP